MPYNGAGVFTQIYNWVTDKANNVLVTASRFQATYDDMATALSTCMTRDGQSPPTADIPMGGFQLTGLADGTAADDAATVGQVPALVGSGTYFNAGNSGAALSIDWTDGVNQQLTLTANTTLTLGDGVTPGWYTLKILQDATGNRTITWAGANYSASRWVGNGAAPVLVGTLSGANFVKLFWDGTQWFQYWVGPVARRNNYHVRATRDTSGQVIGTGATATVVFNSALVDTYSEWDTGTGVFTAKVAGLYRLTAMISVTVATGGASVFIQATIAATNQFLEQFVPTVYNGQEVGLTADFVYNMAVGDTAFLQVINATAGNVTVTTGSTCQITRVGGAQ